MPMRRAGSQWITVPVSWPSDKSLCIARSTHHTAHSLYTPGHGLSHLLAPSLLFLGSCSKLIAPSPSPWGSAQSGTQTKTDTSSIFKNSNNTEKSPKKVNIQFGKIPPVIFLHIIFSNKPDQPRSTRSGNSAGPFTHRSY